MDVVVREALIRANVFIKPLESLEFNHPTFAQPLRLVNHPEDLMLPIEAGAPFDAGADALFIAVGFELQLPEVDDQVDSAISVRIDGVSGIVQTLLANANASVVPIECIVRSHIFNVDTEIATPDGVVSQQVRNVAVTKTSVAISIGYTNSANSAFPSQKYTSYSNPGLVT